MSVRRSPPGAPVVLSRATPPGKVAPSRRLQEVLRAGVTVVSTPVDASESGLTRALKKTSLVPTGACVARTFDPDYCAYDRYYTIGVAVVSATLGVLAETRAIANVANAIINAVHEVLGRQCHVPEEDGWVYPNPQAKRFDQMDWFEKRDATKKFSFLCKSLDAGLDQAEFPLYLGLEDSPLKQVAMQLFLMIYKPVSAVSEVAQHLFDGGATFVRKEELNQMLKNSGHRDARIEVMDNWRKIHADALYRETLHDWINLASTAWILKYVSRYLNEHALMVASFFRVNAKRLDNGEPALLDIKDFVRRCKEDIANGPNPPPEPPEYDGEPYSPFSPGKMERQQREAKERRRLAELRARREARDPLLEGLDYPETYASASDAY